MADEGLPAAAERVGDGGRALPVAARAEPAGLGEFLAAARIGDASAFAEIHRRFARVVHGIALARVGTADAEDVTQEVFVAIHRGLTLVREPEAFPGWICTVARNVATGHLRSRRRRLETKSLEDTPAPEPARSDAELRGRVLVWIGNLPEAYRETLVLRLVEGLTGPEIAERTGLSHGSVRVNLTRGMVLLRPYLRREGWA